MRCLNSVNRGSKSPDLSLNSTLLPAFPQDGRITFGHNDLVAVPRSASRTDSNLGPKSAVINLAPGRQSAVLPAQRDGGRSMPIRLAAYQLREPIPNWASPTVYAANDPGFELRFRASNHLFIHLKSVPRILPRSRQLKPRGRQLGAPVN
jgi:hypothetical protein